MTHHGGRQFLSIVQFDQLLQGLQQEGVQCIGPKQVDGAILYTPFQNLSDLPKGISDRQSPGCYRLDENQHDRYFGWANGPQALKPLLFSPQESLWSAERTEQGGITFQSVSPEISPLAVVGVRGCDLAALSLMDRHFLREGEEDPWYRARRQQLLLIAVECTAPSESCFCVSTGTGPEVTEGYDLRLHELNGGFLMDAGSERGEEILKTLDLIEASESMMKEASDALMKAASQQQRRIASADFRPLFKGREESEQWDSVAERCLACGNCTALCPTCFCHREEDVSGLDLSRSNHQRVWDSCFTAEHSQLHGVPVRSGTRERYRQWMTHKLGGWHDQFGESGCVGCGRCITWCPVRIDFVAESAHFAEESP